MDALDAKDFDAALHECEAELLASPDADSLYGLKIVSGLYLYRFSRQPSETTALSAAERYVQRALELAPDDPGALNLLAMIRLEQGDYARSETIYLGLLHRSDVLPASSLSNLGEVYRRWGKHDLAEAKLKEAIDDASHPPAILAAYQRLGRLYEETNRKEDAKQTYQAAIDFAKEVPQEALDFGGMLDGEIGDSSQAIADMEARLNELSSH